MLVGLWLGRDIVDARYVTFAPHARASRRLGSCVLVDAVYLNGKFTWHDEGGVCGQNV